MRYGESAAVEMSSLNCRRTEVMPAKINRWEVFNTTNSVRFDGATASTGLDSGSFGKFGQTVTNKRAMQFALRYEF